MNSGVKTGDRYIFLFDRTPALSQDIFLTEPIRAAIFVFPLVCLPATERGRWRFSDQITVRRSRAECR